MPCVEKKHKHVELRELLQNRFSKLKTYSQIPSARQVATSYRVSTITIRQALVALRVDGMKYTIPGSGTYVTGKKLSNVRERFCFYLR